METAWTQTLYEINIWAVYLAEKLTCICRQRLNISALPLSEDGVERKGTFTGTGKTGEDHERITWNRDVDIFEIVNTCPPNAKFLLRRAEVRHSTSLRELNHSAVPCFTDIAQLTLELTQFVT